MNKWIPVEIMIPRGPDSPQGRRNLSWFYVLAVDAQNRMSVGYFTQNGQQFNAAKPIGKPAHWMPLPEPPHPSVEPYFNGPETIANLNLSTP